MLLRYNLMVFCYVYLFFKSWSILSLGFLLQQCIFIYIFMFFNYLAGIVYPFAISCGIRSQRPPPLFQWLLSFAPQHWLMSFDNWLMSIYRKLKLRPHTLEMHMLAIRPAGGSFQLLVFSITFRFLVLCEYLGLVIQYIGANT